jgi:hypothetical protein
MLFCLKEGLEESKTDSAMGEQASHMTDPELIDRSIDYFPLIFALALLVLLFIMTHHAWAK